MPKLTLNVEALSVESFEMPPTPQLVGIITPRTNEPGCVSGSKATVCFC